jgi:tubulin beta
VSVCDEHGVGGSGEYCGDNDPHLNRSNLLYHDALGGKYVPRAVLFDLDPGVIGAVTLSHRPSNSLVRIIPCTTRASQTWVKCQYAAAGHIFFIPPVL